MTELSLHTAAFSSDFVDVPELHAATFERLRARVRDVLAAADNETLPATRALVVLGPAGAGKTHLFSRLRLQGEHPATVILLRPFFGLDMTPRDILAALVDQLCLPRDTGASALETILAAWRGADTTSRDIAIASLIERDPRLGPVAHLLEAVLGLEETAGVTRWAELAWLSGREPRPRAPGQSLPPDGAVALSEADVLHVLRIVALLASSVAPLVLVFDQLENLADDAKRALAYGNLIAELVDSVPGLSLVQLALTSEWLQHIEPCFALSHKSRVAAEVLSLNTPTRHERELLLRAWAAHLAPSKGRRKKFPAPLSPERYESLLEEPGLTPRMLLRALQRAAAGEDDEPVPAAEVGSSSLGHGWSEQLETVRRDLESKSRAGLPIDPGELAEGLAAALATSPRLSCELRTERERVSVHVAAPGHELTVLMVTGLHHATVTAALVKATELARSCKVVVLREARFELAASWTAVQERRTEFERMANARWLWLEQEDAIRLLALARFVSLARAGRVRDASDRPVAWESVRAWLNDEPRVAEWSSVAAIARWLSDVPRERASVPADVAPAVGVDGAAAASPAPTLKEWLRAGRALGVESLRRTVRRLRR